MTWADRQWNPWLTAAGWLAAVPFAITLAGQCSWFDRLLFARDVVPRWACELHRLAVRVRVTDNSAICQRGAKRAAYNSWNEKKKLRELVNAVKFMSWLVATMTAPMDVFKIKKMSKSSNFFLELS